MTTADSHIGSNRQHRLSDQVPANTHNTRARRKGARDSGPSAAASTSPPAPGVSGEHLILYGSGLPGLGMFNLITGVALLVASVLAGFLWTAFGPAAPSSGAAYLPESLCLECCPGKPTANKGGHRCEPGS